MAIQSKIAIVGGGISGVAAARQLAEHNPVVFEATDTLGGVWKHCSYASTKLQTPRCDYEFSDFPWDRRDNSNFPYAHEIVDYVYSYAKRFDVLKFVKFNSKVVEIKFVGRFEKSDGDYGRLLPGEPVWEVGVKTGSSDDVEWYAFEFVLICSGKYGDVPSIPKFSAGKGPEVFRGRVMHTLDYCKLSPEESTKLLKDKKVVIIGSKKSALDLTVETVEANRGPNGKPCTMIARDVHWNVPHYSIWGLPFYMFYSTRAAQFLHRGPNHGVLRSLLCYMLSPMRSALSKMIESYLAWKLPLAKYGMKPTHSFQEDYASCQMPILPENFYPEVEKGNIRIKRSNSSWFWEGGVELEDGTKLDADVVVLATGYDGKRKLRAIIPEPFRSLLESPMGMMPLYRGTINPLIPNMAFVGYIESVSNLHTAEMRCKWLSRLVGGKFKLPSVDKMLEQITREMEIMKASTRFYKRSCISTFSINHTDEICEEMGWSSRRKNSWIAEAFSPYTSQDYYDDDKN
ncbi:probable flavin-containing monooxygenase 1 [Andrographis paniculata]|uniref:probable flavin-containing monooxygenase 1 n=1 Tax=Andrographis paniculata TaxID=175694 RepID=UPI0021E837C9|nr:probable flavin-containing monooxygenase 1 [Andrographis paniculata]